VAEGYRGDGGAIVVPEGRDPDELSELTWDLVLTLRVLGLPDAQVMKSIPGSVRKRPHEGLGV
jgi:hypothetical protein